jgi:hypothetical protein
MWLPQGKTRLLSLPCDDLGHIWGTGRALCAGRPISLPVVIGVSGLLR